MIQCYRTVWFSLSILLPYYQIALKGYLKFWSTQILESYEKIKHIADKIRRTLKDIFVRCNTTILDQNSQH